MRTIFTWRCFMVFYLFSLKQNKCSRLMCKKCTGQLISFINTCHIYYIAPLWYMIYIYIYYIWIASLYIYFSLVSFINIWAIYFILHPIICILYLYCTPIYLFSLVSFINICCIFILHPYYIYYIYIAPLFIYFMLVYFINICYIFYFIGFFICPV